MELALSKPKESIRTSTLSSIMFILVLFPYITPIDTSFDTQIWSVLFSIFVFIGLIMKNGMPLTKPMFALLIILIYSCLVFLLRNHDLTAMRSLIGYVSIFFLSYIAYHTFQLVNHKLFVRAMYVWFAVSLIQITVSKTFGSFLLPRLSTTSVRGITSLSVEPSLLAVTCIFFIVINDMLRSKGAYSNQKYWVITFMLVAQILFSYSGMGILLLIFYFVSKFIAVLFDKGIVKSPGKLMIVALLPIIMIWLFKANETLSNTRVGVLLKIASNDPINLLYTDASIADRASHIAFSLYSLSYSSFFGLGLGTWNNYAGLIQSEVWSWAADMSRLYMNLSGRIMSGWGTALFEIGFMGIVLMLIYLYVMVKGIKQNKAKRSVIITSMLTVFFMMWLSVPLAFPLFGYTFGMFMYFVYKEPLETSRGQ